jgi:hypothetical protein
MKHQSIVAALHVVASGGAIAQDGGFHQRPLLKLVPKR